MPNYEGNSKIVIDWFSSCKFCTIVHYTAVIHGNHTQTIQNLRESFLITTCKEYVFIQKPIELFTSNYMLPNKLFPFPKLFKLYIPHFLGGNKL